MSWTHTVEAYNTAVDSTNRMHDDAVAQTFGFRGGLVPGPWIHVGTRAVHRGVARTGAEFEVRGRLVGEYERKGHRFADLDVEVTADGSPLWSAFHTAIWRPRSTA